MWLKCCMLFVIAFIANAQGNCDMPNNQDEWKTDLAFQVKDDELDARKNYKIVNIEAVEFESDYIDYELNDLKTDLEFFLTNKFPNYVDNEDTDNKDYRITFTCSNGAVITKTITLYVTQTIFIKPYFDEKDLNFKLIMPILPGSSIQTVNIKAVDKNLGNQNLVFTTLDECNELFEFGKSAKVNKIYNANLKTKDKLVNLGKSMICPIKVQGAHGSDTTSINLEVNVEESVPPNPMFEKPLYIAEYTEDDTIKPVSIKLVNTFFDATFTVSSDVYEDHFKFDKKQMTLTIDPPLPNDAFDDKSYITVTIEATYNKAEYPGKTIVIINSPKKDGIIDVPDFEKPLYVAQYVDSLHIVHEDITLKPTDHEATFKIESIYKDHFEFKNNKLIIIDALPESVFKDENFISVTIYAKYEDVLISGKTVVIIKGPKKSEIPVFEEALYEMDNTADTKIEIKLKIMDENNIAYFEINSAYKKYFKFENNILVLSEAIPESEFIDKLYISVTIEAKYEGGTETGKTIVIINAPSKNEIPFPVFEKSLYEIDYNDEMEVEILLKHTDEDYKASFEIISDHEAYFIFENNKLALSEPIPESEFIDKSYISVIIEATYEGVAATGKTVVVIEGLENNEISVPVFKKPLYEAQFTMPNIIEHDIIELKSVDPTHKVVFTIESKYVEYFNFENGILTLKDPLPEDAFKPENYISLTIEAKYEDATVSGKTVVLIKGPENNEIQVPVFKKPLYEAQFTMPNIIEHDIIELESVDPTHNVEFAIYSKYAKYFNFENGILTLKYSLPEDAFKPQNYISLTIEAKYEDATVSGQTVVLIKGPENNEIPVPVFKKPLYEAQFTMPNIIEHDVIELKSVDPTHQIEFTIDSEYAEYFNFENGILTLKDPLPEDAFKSENYISVTIEAKYEGAQVSGKTVVLIKGPENNEIPVPVFKKPLYEAQFTMPNIIEHDMIELELVDSTHQVEFTIDSKYAEYFNFENGVLTLKDPLPEDAFKPENYFSLTIEAKYEGATVSGKTVVLIKGPENNEIPVPVFKKPLYEAQFTMPNIIEHDVIELKSVDPTHQIEFTIDSEYAEYFNFENGILTLKDPLPEDAFKSENYISVTIEAKYEGAQVSGKTVVLIKGPENNEIPVPVFKKPLYEAQFTMPNIIEHDMIELELVDSTHQVEFTIDSKYAKYFNFENGILTLKDPLPEDAFKPENYFSLTIEAKYEGATVSGKTVVLIKGPENNEIPVPVFKKPLYEAQFTMPNIIEHDIIELESVDPTHQIEFTIDSEYAEYFNFENGILTLKDPLPEDAFKSENYISVTIEAKYEGAQVSGKTVVLIKGPENNEIPVPVFKKPLYEAQFTMPNIIEHDMIELELVDSTHQVEFTIDSKYAKYFNFENGILTLKDPLPEDAFKPENYFSLTIEAKYEGATVSGKTVVLIKGPENNEIPVPVFKKPLYEAQFTMPNIIEHDIIELESVDPTPNVEFTIDSKYAEHLNFKNGKLTVIGSFPDDVFDDQYFISVTIKATYKEGSISGYTVVIIKAPESSGSVHYRKHIDVVAKDPPLTGLIGTYEATSDDSSETIEYKIKGSDISNLFEYKANGELIIKEILPDKLYYQITLLAKTTDSQDTMDVIVFANRALSNDDFQFPYSLKLVKVKEEDGNPTTIAQALPGHKLSIIGDNTEGWFETKDNNIVVNKIDREHPKLKDMLVAQVQIQVKAEKKTTLKSSNTIFNKIYDISRKQESCLEISPIPIGMDTMHIVVTIEDINDQPPVFVEKNPLVIGYPSSELAEFIAPPYLVKVTATDDDIGINAVIRYTVDKNFKIDPVNGIIYPAEELSSDTEFTVTATDKDGAEDGISTPLKIKVKILDENHINVITVKNIAYSEIENFITNLGTETKTTVKYLTNTALPKTGTAEEKKSLRLARANDKIPVLRIVLYALDNEKIVPAAEFKTLIENSKLSESVDVKQYEANTQEPSDDTGYIAAVSTLAVLLGLVIIGVVLGYIFYIRPKILGGPIKYEKHDNTDSMYSTPVESRIESKAFDRRPTGFPVGFTPTDIEDEDVESGSDKDENVDEVINKENSDSEASYTEVERKKSVVKFNQNVTEIEISEL